MHASRPAQVSGNDRRTFVRDVGVTSSIHIVRRYGKVGGMEHYVWELTHNLAAAGNRVKIICEHQYHHLEDLPGAERIEVHAIGKIWPEKPRWVHMFRFARRVDRLIASMDTAHWVVHSHEITGVHDVTTFHGNSIKSREYSALDRFSPRIRMWEMFERKELTESQEQRIFPVSPVVASTLSKLYPQCADRLESPAYPGVSKIFGEIKRVTDGKTLGFIGVEWHRKGLDILCTAVASMRKQDPDISLLVAGCDANAVRHLFQGWKGGYQLLGWTDPVAFFQKIDALVLPARAEPFGMVVAEANAAGIPVVVSSHCGIAEFVTGRRGSVIDIDRIDDIKSACNAALALQQTPEPMGFSWERVAYQYASVYAEVIDKKSRQSTKEPGNES